MSIPRLSRAALAAALSLLAAATVALGLNARASADDPVAPIASAPDLHWGFKATWRNYAQDPEVSGGAEKVAPTGGALAYDLEWAFDSGGYDPATQTTQLEYSGSVRWKGHKASEDGVSPPPGYSGEPDPYILDVTFSDPRITISRDESVLSVRVASRDADTWQMVDYGRVPVVNLDVLGVTPSVAGGVTAWPDLTATVTAPGHEAMAGFYRVGQVVDPVSFSYEGPGGAPDLSEHWDTPGAATLKLVENELFYEGEAAIAMQPLWVDRENLIVHSARSVEVGGLDRVEVRAFSLARMEAVGAPIVLPTTQISVGAFDTSDDRLLYREIGETGMRRWLRFDPVGGQYETGVLADPQMGETSFFGTGAAPFLVWDEARDRGYRIQRIVPPGVVNNDFDKHEWRLTVFEEGGDGVWGKRAFVLPGFPAGQNREGYAASTPSAPRLAVASDGSLIALASARLNLAATEKIPGAYRIVFNQADDAIDVQPLPGLEVLNQNSTGGTFSFLQASENGHLLLAQASGEEVVHCRLEAGTVGCDDPVSVDDNVEPPPYEEHRYAIDPADGTIWFGGVTSQRIAAFGGGAFLGGQFFKERNPKGGPVLVGEDHFVYAQTNDGSAAESGGSKTWGYGKFERLGFVPAVTSQPEDDAVALGLEEASEEATFTSTATGDPAPQRQWQVKPPGALKFTDLPGESGETLSVDATRADGGAEYRAVYSNAAGKVATDPAALAVAYAPAVLQDPVGVKVVEGVDAQFALLSDGDPAPTVTWQRRVGGFWQPIDPGDENFEIDGHRLTVLETNTEQSGALFRAKLANGLGSVFSKAAKLTVTPKTTIPPEGIDLENVSLEWTGSPEIQKVPFFGDSNFFSAGASDGKEATYDAFADNAGVFQVSSSGQEAIATWATRAAHVSGGGKQLVRLYGGDARIEPDGSTAVKWDAAFSVNFYGGLVPFTFTDPELVVDADGVGALSADMSGCESSQANPNECAPFAPMADVTVATFSGVEVDPAGAVTIDPDYEGVEVTVPVPYAPQDRGAAGWGAWPQSFVDFHLETGLSSHWYSSGGTLDPYKAPDPFTVDFDGEALPPEPEPEPEPTPPSPGPQPKAPAGGPSPSAELAAILLAGKVQAIGRKRVVRVATLACPGDGFCAVGAPRRVKLRAGGERQWAKVLAPPTLEAGGRAVLKVKLTKAGLRRLGRRTARGRLRVAVRSQAGVVKRAIPLRIKKRGKGRKGRGGGPTGVGGPKSEPLSPEPPLLARPATAVDVSGVRVSWAPRDSWVRYASSGVAAGDGILFANGAAGVASTASPCPDRPSASDAQLPYAVEFAPRASWYDPVSGAAGIYGQGSVSFRWAAHSIDLTASDPEIEINGASSRAVFRFSGSGGTAYPEQRAPLVSLDTSGQPTVTNGGRTLSYGLMRGTLTADGVNVFAGFYPPPDNDEFGCVSVEFTVP